MANSQKQGQASERDDKHDGLVAKRAEVSSSQL